VKIILHNCKKLDSITYEIKCVTNDIKKITTSNQFVSVVELLSFKVSGIHIYVFMYLVYSKLN